MTLFGSCLESGVRRVEDCVDAAGVREAAAVHGLDFSRVDLCGVRDKAGLLSETARSLGFPSHFGMNWDALNDSLTDMSWRPAAGYVVLFTGLRAFAENAVADVEILTRILVGTAGYWKQRRVPFYIILSERPLPDGDLGVQPG
ncbi:MAG: barnase inhibitor [Dehalococcoidia bacterium]|nr:MAG: barnase inhibitor [Dehalococcoidia bacterium]